MKRLCNIPFTRKSFLWSTFSEKGLASTSVERAFLAWSNIIALLRRREHFVSLKTHIIFLYRQQIYFLGFQKSRSSTSVERAFSLHGTKIIALFHSKEHFVNQKSCNFPVSTTTLFSRFSKKVMYQPPRNVRFASKAQKIVALFHRKDHFVRGTKNIDCVHRVCGLTLLERRIYMVPVFVVCVEVERVKIFAKKHKCSKVIF